MIIVSNYDRVIRSPSFNMQLPSVIALKDYIIPQTKPSFTRFNVFLRDKFSCQYCGSSEELTFDHLLPRSKGGETITKNCVPCCLSCNGKKSDIEVLKWYRSQKFYDPRRSMAIRAWFNNDLKLASVLLNYIK